MQTLLEDIPADSVQTILNTAMDGMSPLDNIFSQSLRVHANVPMVAPAPQFMSMKDWAKAQLVHEAIGEVI